MRNDQSQPTMPRMRIIVCGGRAYADAERVASILDEYRSAEPHIIAGSRGGADGLALRYAMAHNWPHTVVPARWATHGHAAGPIRNEEMARAGADLCIAFPGGRGTADMMQRAHRLGIEVRVVDVVQHIQARRAREDSDDGIRS